MQKAYGFTENQIKHIEAQAQNQYMFCLKKYGHEACG
jgi:hypothetical protein